MLHALLSRVSDAVLLLRPHDNPSDLRVAFVNDAFVNMTGWGRDDVIGSPPGRLLSPETDPNAIRRLYVSPSVGETGQEEMVLRRKDGAPLWVDVTSFALADAAGAPWYCGIYRDLTDTRHEQARFRALIEHVTDIVVVVDPEMGISYVSPAVERLLGFKPEEIVGQRVLDVIEVDEPEHYEALFGAMPEGDMPTESLEVRAVHRDGTAKTLEVSINDRLSDPAVGGVVLTVRDITDQTEAAVQLRRSEEWAHALLQGGNDLVMVTDAEGVIYYTSPGVTHMLGWMPDQLVGTSCFDLVHPSQTDEVVDEWKGLFIEGADDYLPSNYRLRHVDGTWRHGDIRARNMLDHPAVRGIVIHARDVTERAEAAAQLRRSEEWAQALVQGGSDVVTVTDGDGVVLYTSPAVETVLGYEPEGLVGTSAFDVMHPDDLDRVRSVFADELAGAGVSSPTRLRARHRDGRWMQLSATFTDMLENPAVGGVVINARDITDRWEAEKLLTQQAQALEAVARGAPLDTTLYRVAQLLEERMPGSRCAIGVVTENQDIRLRAAPTLDRQTVVALDEVGHSSPLGEAVRAGGRRLVVFDDIGAEGRWAPVLEAAPKLARYSCWSQLIVRPGRRETLGAVLVFHPDQRGPTAEETELLDRLMYLAAIAIERRTFEAALEHQAMHDDLTDLPNRTLLLDRVAQAVARAARHHTRVAVLFIDLDRFKVINDSLGHAVGDELLIQVAQRLRSPLRLGDTVGRLGGDEFLVVCERVEGEESAANIADKLAELLSAPFLLGDTEMFVTASIGIALSGGRSVSAEALVRNADMAMYRAKEQGRARYSIFEEDLAVRAVERHELEQALRHALDEDQFELHYQPLIQLSDGAVVGVEALVRWARPERGLVEPAAFIPLAEENGFILPLGEWIIGEAVRQTATWPRLPNGADLAMTINLSARQLEDPGLIDFISGEIGAAGVEPGRVCFEITETTLVDDIDAAIAMVEKLKSLGVLIAIDDFGTGYATLEYLRRFSMADYLKIDRSFVEGMDTGGSKETAIVAGAISLAKSLDFTVVAEGVQTEGQLAALRGLDCDLAQGYYFSRPLPAEAAVSLLDRSGGWT